MVSAIKKKHSEEEMTLFDWWRYWYEKLKGTIQLGPGEFRKNPGNTVRQRLKTTLLSIEKSHMDQTC